ncbi:hypothetical protein [Aestuariivivens sediminicola]|uniref:hypothetical protein n=1 Tax=Aestuariivivens sediminicola TaxID=2913560 RepID=UPI001F584240|nr:hypothetical protein [Aestuariivivens sediminicola]
MKKRHLKAQCVLAALLLIFCFNGCHSGRTQKQGPFIKGVYGNPGSLLKAGYNFEALGVNALFVRSHSLNDALYRTAREQGCQVFVEFPVLNGRQFLENHKQCQPIDAEGEASGPADWFMGICPTCPDFKADRQQHLKDLLTRFKVNGVFLDYLHWHAQFETPDPILPETCFCARCTDIFSKTYRIELQGETTADVSNYILSFHDREWRAWRSSILTEWIRDLKHIVKSKQPESKLGLFYCAWYPEEYDAALHRILGIAIDDFINVADVLSPMLFHHMTDRPVHWVSDYTTWLDSVCNFTRPHNKPDIWPIVQAHNSPGTVSPEEFREVMQQGMSPPSGGIMMFSDVSLLQDPRKIEVMKALYKVEPK